MLKKYAYNGVWFGKKDYYNIPFAPTLQAPTFLYSGTVHELESPSFTWDERISFKVDQSTKTRCLSDNILYKMAKKHVSTIAWYQMQRVINDDVVYWYKPTYNLSFVGEIHASSGNVKYLNDFVCYGYNSILNEKEPFKNTCNLWQPKLEDKIKEIVISFHTPKRLRYINVYEDCNIENHIKKLRVTLSNSLEVELECNSNGTASKLDFKKNVEISDIKFVVEEYVGQPGIAEIELLPEEAIITEWPLELYEEQVNKTAHKTIKMRVEQLLMNVRFLLSFKIKYELDKRRTKKGE